MAARRGGQALSLHDDGESIRRFRKLIVVFAIVGALGVLSVLLALACLGRLADRWPARGDEVLPPPVPTELARLGQLLTQLVGLARGVLVHVLSWFF